MHRTPGCTGNFWCQRQFSLGFVLNRKRFLISISFAPWFPLSCVLTQVVDSISVPTRSQPPEPIFSCRFRAFAGGVEKFPAFSNWLASPSSGFHSCHQKVSRNLNWTIVKRRKNGQLTEPTPPLQIPVRIHPLRPNLNFHSPSLNSPTAPQPNMVRILSQESGISREYTGNRQARREGGGEGKMALVAIWRFRDLPSTGWTAYGRIELGGKLIQREGNYADPYRGSRDERGRGKC